MQKCKYNDAPFVPSNDCSSWESCTAEAYEQGKADAKAEHDKECDRCLFSLRKERMDEAKKDAIDSAMEVIEHIYHDHLYCIEDECDDTKCCDLCLYEAVMKNLKHLKGTFNSVDSLLIKQLRTVNEEIKRRKNEKNTM